MKPLSLCAAFAVVACTPAAFADKSKAPSVEQALALAPIQKGVEFDRPTGADAKRCKIATEPEGKSTSWVVRDGDGRMLRRFADANADNVVDTWCYYAGGLEVYRDIDSDYDGRADQYRWFHTAGSRWGIDEDQDTKIDRWRQISPQEVAEEAFLAVQQKDADRLRRLLITAKEARSLGLGTTLAERFDAGRRRASDDFATLLRGQDAISAKSRFADFGAPRPGVIPAGVDGSTKDVTLYENASALVDNDGALEQLLLGSLVKVGDGWRLVESPRAGASGPELANVFSVPTLGGAPASATPSDQVQEWMSELDKLDRDAARVKPEQRTSLTDRRVVLLEKLAAASTSTDEAAQWYQQLAGLLTAAAQAEGYDKGVSRLTTLERSPGVRRVGKDLQAAIRYQRIAAEHGLAFRDPKADYAEVQKKWIADLEAFVEAFPTSPDAADAMLQLGSMAGEFAGDDKVAQRWYSRAAAEFPRTAAGRKAAGAARRLASLGKPLSLSGETLSSKRIDLSRSPYRGRFVLVHYWTTWSSPESDMAAVQAMRKKYRGKFDVVGVNLDSDVAAAKAYVGKQRIGWEHLYDEKGIDGDRAAAMGVINLPLMMLVDDRGRVVNRNLHAGELDSELQRLIR